MDCRAAEGLQVSSSTPGGRTVKPSDQYSRVTSTSRASSESSWPLALEAIAARVACNGPADQRG